MFRRLFFQLPPTGLTIKNLSKVSGKPVSSGSSNKGIVFMMFKNQFTSFKWIPVLKISIFMLSIREFFVRLKQNHIIQESRSNNREQV